MVNIKVWKLFHARSIPNGKTHDFYYQLKYPIRSITTSTDIVSNQNATKQSNLSLLFKLCISGSSENSLAVLMWIWLFPLANYIVVLKLTW